MTAAVALLVAGCARYVPLAPSPVAAENAVATIDEVDLRKLSIDVTLDTPGKQVTGAHLVTGTDMDCNAGLASRNDVRRSVRGATRLTVEFARGDAWPLLQSGATLALALRDAFGDTCLRLPVNEAGGPTLYRIASGGDPFWSGESLRVWVPLESKITPGAQLSFRGGKWFGPLRAGVEAGFGNSFCIRCGTHDIMTAPLAAGLEAFVLRFGRGALGLRADYELRPTWRRFEDNERLKWLQGIRGGVEISTNGLGLPSFPDGPQAAHLGLSVEFAHWAAPGFDVNVVGLAAHLDAPTL